MSKKDLAIIISYSGITEEMIRCAKEVHKSGAKIIAITRFETSALAEIADYNLCVASTELIFRSGVMASRISQLNMIDILYSAYINKHYDESLQKITQTYMNKEDENVIKTVKSQFGLDSVGF